MLVRLLKSQSLTITCVSVKMEQQSLSAPCPTNITRVFKKTGLTITAVTFIKESWATGGRHVCANLPHYGC